MNMKKTNSSYNRTSHPSDVKRQEVLSKIAQQLPVVDIDSPVFQNLKKTNPHAAYLHLNAQLLFTAIANDRPDYIEKAKSGLLRETATLTQMSIQQNFRLSKVQIGNFYGLSDSFYMTFGHWKELGKQDWLQRIYKYKLHSFLAEIIDSVAVAMAVAGKRVVFLNQELAITYGVNKLENKKIVYGELFVSIINSNGLWSFDKDDAIRIKIGTLRAAKKAVARWRGAGIIGEVTHGEAQRIADFLGLIPVENSKRTLVMLKRR